MGVADVVLVSLAAYGATGLAFGLVFVARGVNRVDPVAAHASVGVRLLLLPGAAALWPVMLVKWRRMRAGT